MKGTITFLLSIVLLTGCIVVAASNNDEQLQSLPKFEVGNCFILGRYNDEPILWRFIGNDETNGMLMLSDKILCFKAFNTIPEEPPKGSNLWEDSTMRLWLNSDSTNKQSYGESGFLSRNNFSSKEIKAIKPVKHKTFMTGWQAEALGMSQLDIALYTFANEYRQGWTQGDNFPQIKYVAQMEWLMNGKTYETEDRMFLLDEGQVFEIYKNFKTAAAELAKPIAEYGKEDYNEAYWLRSPYNDLGYVSKYSLSDTVPLITYGCTISGEASDIPHTPQAEFTDPFNEYIFGEIGDRYDKHTVTDEYGIRPAFYLDTDNAVILSGSGTEDDPYVLGGKKKDGISVFLNGLEISFDQSPIIENNRTLVPFRAIFEALGAEVSWDEATQTVIGKFNDTTIKLTIGSETAYCNEKPIPLDVPPKILNDRTLVPLRFVAENFGFKVDWDEEKQRVDINM